MCSMPATGGGSQTPAHRELEAAARCEYNWSFLSVRNREFKYPCDSCAACQQETPAACGRCCWAVRAAPQAMVPSGIVFWEMGYHRNGNLLAGVLDSYSWRHWAWVMLSPNFFFFLHISSVKFATYCAKLHFLDWRPHKLNHLILGYM